jgi:hypothetical protein
MGNAAVASSNPIKPIARKVIVIMLYNQGLAPV